MQARMNDPGRIEFITVPGPVRIVHFQPPVFPNPVIPMRTQSRPNPRRILESGCAGFLVLLVILSLASCAKSPAPRTRVERIQGVPFYPDDQYWCGPASLAGVLDYWGESVDPARIAEKIYSPGARGTLPSDLRWYARQRGFQARISRGTLGGLEQSVDRGQPVIVLVEYETLWGSYPHFMVVLGYTARDLIVNSGTQRETRVSREEFRRAWERTGRLQILVEPKQKPAGNPTS